MGAIWLLALCNPIVAINGVLAGSLMGREQFRLVALGNTFANSGLLLFPLAVAFVFSTDLFWLIAASMSARIVGGIIIGVGVWRSILHGHPVRFERHEFRRLANFGVWVMVSALVGPLMLFADRFLIGALYGAVAVAAYAIPYQIAVRTMLLPNSITSALFPRFAAEQDKAARERCAQFVAMIGLIFAPVIIGLVCLAGPLLALWLGSAFDPRSVAVAHWVLIGCWFNAIALVPFSFLQARGHPRFTAMLHLAELPIFVVLLLTLGSRYGLAGFAAAFALRCAGDWAALMVRAAMAKRAALMPLLAPAMLIASSMCAAALWDHWFALLAAATFLELLSLAAIMMQMPDALRKPLMKLPIAGAVLARVWN